MPVALTAQQVAADNSRALLKEADPIVDAFDNSASRRLVREQARRQGSPCLHVGVAPDYCEIIWDEQYRIPSDTAADVCDYPLARNLVLLAVAIASEAIVNFALAGARSNWSATLRDLAIRPLAA